MTLICGIDPGMSGALAFLDTATGSVETIDMPVLRLARGGKTRGEVDAHALAALFWERHTGHVFLEHVWARGGEGQPASFSFGEGYGVIKGVIAAVAVPLTLVAPNKWKRAMGVLDGKSGARARASQLLPAAADQWRLVKHDGRAEAALIALYGARELAGIARAA